MRRLVLLAEFIEQLMPWTRSYFIVARKLLMEIQLKLSGGARPALDFESVRVIIESADSKYLMITTPAVKIRFFFWRYTFAKDSTWHPLGGALHTDDVLTVALEEVQAEAGLELEKDKLKLGPVAKDCGPEKATIHLVYSKLSQEAGDCKITINQAEVGQYKWFSAAELIQEMEDNPDSWLSVHIREEVETYLKK